MAFIGMRHLVVARMNEHTPGSEPTYEKGMIFGKAIQANLTITRNNNPLYADDAVAEDDNGITAMTADIGADDVMEDVRVYAMGLKEVKPSGVDGVTEYHDTDTSAPYVGFGYIRVRRKGGVRKFQAIWMYKCTLAEESEEAKTKGETIEWGTPTVKLRAAAIDTDSSGDLDFRKKALFTREDEAIAWLHKMANIEATPLAANPDSAQAVDTPTKAATK